MVQQHDGLGLQCLHGVPFSCGAICAGMLWPAQVPREAPEAGRWPQVPRGDLGICSGALLGERLVSPEVRGFEGDRF